MDKEQWLKQIFNGAPPGSRGGGGSSASDNLPPAPKLESGSVQTTSLTLSWHWASAPANAQYELCYRGATGGGSWQTQRLPIASGSLSGHVLRNLSANSSYSIAMQVIEPGAAPKRGAELQATTAPAPPTGLEAIEVHSTSLKLRWRPSSGTGLRYAVYGSAALNFEKLYSGTALTCEISGLTRGEKYGFRVCAMNTHGGASDFSPEMTVRAGGDGGGGGGGVSSGRGSGVTPDLLSLTHDALSMRWVAPPGGATNYVVELAEGEDGVVPDDEEWAVIYEGAPPGCEISYLAAETEYHMRVSYTDHQGHQSDFGPPLIVTTPEEPAKPKKTARKKAPPPKAPAPPPKPPPKPPPRPPPTPKPRQPPPQPRTPRPEVMQQRSPRPTPSPRRQPPPTSPRAPPERKPALPSNTSSSARTPRRPPAPPRSARKETAPGSDDDDDDDDDGGRSHRRSTTSSASGIHERLYGMHAEQQERMKDKRQEMRSSLSMSNISLRDRASVGMSSPRREGSTPFGSSSPRPHLWLGAAAAAGPTTDAMAASPRGSRRGSGSAAQLSSASAGEEAAEAAPGPGAYDSASQFKSDLRKDPSKGSSSAFKSKTRRLFSDEGEVLEAQVYPGRAITEGPGVGTYTPKDHASMGAAAAALARQAEKLAALRTGPKAKQPDRFHAEKKLVTPGPGSYEVGKVIKAKEDRVYEVKHSPFKSGSRRSLPWGGRGSDSRFSTRARTVGELELDDLEGPGPGEYKVAGGFEKLREKTRRAPSGAWTKGPSRFAQDPSDDKLTPPATMYTPNYNQCSGRA